MALGFPADAFPVYLTPLPSLVLQRTGFAPALGSVPCLTSWAMFLSEWNGWQLGDVPQTKWHSTLGEWRHGYSPLWALVPKVSSLCLWCVQLSVMIGGLDQVSHILFTWGTLSHIIWQTFVYQTGDTEAGELNHFVLQKLSASDEAKISQWHR